MAEARSLRAADISVGVARSVLLETMNRLLKTPPGDRYPESHMDRVAPESSRLLSYLRGPLSLPLLTEEAASVPRPVEVLIDFVAGSVWM